MNEDPEIWFRAYLVMRQHGRDAAVHAAMRSGERLAMGDMDGANLWRRVASAIGRLEDKVRLN